MLLTELAIKNAKPQKKPYKMSDGDGMFLLVDPKGKKHWRFRYYFGGKEKLLSFGAYPEVTLKEARQKRYDARKLVREGIDPSAQRQEEKRLAQFDSANTFKTVAKEWFEANKNKWTPDHADRLWRRLELHTYPKLGNRPIKEIRPVELLDVIRKIEKRDATHLSHRVLQISRAVFRYAIITGRAEYNSAGDLQGALVAHKETHYPTLDVKELPQFLKALEEVHTTKQNKLAIRLLMFTFMRQGELRHSKWEDIDFMAKVWRIPAENTKMRDAHTPIFLQIFRAIFLII